MLFAPDPPPAPSRFEFRLCPITGAVTNPFLATQRIYDWQASYVEASVLLPPMPRAVAQAWVDFLASLDGQANSFQFPPSLVASYPESLTTDGATPRSWCLLKNDTDWSVTTAALHGIAFEIRERPPVSTGPPVPIVSDAVLYTTSAHILPVISGYQHASAAVPGSSSFGLSSYLGLSSPAWGIGAWSKTSTVTDISGTRPPYVAAAYQWKTGYSIIFNIVQGAFNPNEISELWIYDVHVVLTFTDGSMSTLWPSTAAVVGNASNNLTGVPATSDAYNYVLNPGNAIDGDPTTYAVIHRDPVNGPREVWDWPNLQVTF